MLLQQGPRFFIPLEPTCCLFVACCHEFRNRESSMVLFYLLKENFKNPLFDSLIMGKNFDNLSYLSSGLLSQRGRFRRMYSNILRGIESDLTYTKVAGIVYRYILWYGSLWHPLSRSMLSPFTSWGHWCPINLITCNFSSICYFFVVSFVVSLY